MIKKKYIHFKFFEDFNKKKLSANKDNTKYTVGIEEEVKDCAVGEEPDISFKTIIFVKDRELLFTHGTLYHFAPSGENGIAELAQEVEDNELVTAVALVDLDARLRAVEDKLDL